MANPILNDSTWNKAAKNPGWGAPDPTTRSRSEERRVGKECA